MPASFLIRHWKKELQVLQVNFNRLKKASVPEAIHDLRVAVKKLRSYYKFYSEIFEEDSTLLFAGTEKLFSVLGKQRNIEVCIELLGELKYLEKVPGFCRHLKIFLAEVKLRSKSALNSYNVDDLNSLTLEIEQTMSVQLEEMILEKARAFIVSTIDEAHHDLHKFDKSFHLLRKKLKDIFYWSKMLPVHFYFSTAQLKSLDNALDLLGKIQDREILRSNARFFRRSFLGKGEEEHGTIKQLENLLKENKKTMLEKAHELLKSLLVKK